MGANVVVKKGNGKPFVEYEDIWQATNARLKEYDQALRDSGSPDIYVGYSSNDGFIFRPGPMTSPNARLHQSNVASTNTSKTFGGNVAHNITKKEIQQYNIKHPNEIAGDL